jgi:hypothetical protein
MTSAILPDRACHREVRRRAGAVHVFTTATAFTILESIRLDLGYRNGRPPLSPAGI